MVLQSRKGFARFDEQPFTRHPKRTFGSLQRLDRASSINKAGPVNGSLLSTYVASAKCQLTTLNSVFLSSAKFDGSLPLKSVGQTVAKKAAGAEQVRKWYG